MAAPKILVISNNALNVKNSNGRTLGLLLEDIPKENLMQFYIRDEAVSPELVGRAYRITDRAMVKGLFSRKIRAEAAPVESAAEAGQSAPRQAVKKSAATVLMREIVWGLGFRRTDWIETAKAFKPDSVLLLMGDNAFLMKLSRYIARKCASKMMVYTTEDYCFKTWNYFGGGKPSLFFRIFKSLYDRTIAGFMDGVRLCVANTPLLAREYHEKFSVDTDVIMAAASASEPGDGTETKKRMIYAGNLNLDRYKSIIRIAEALRETDDGFVIDVYGHADTAMTAEMSRCPNIKLHGFIPYNDLLREMKSAFALLHCESFDDFYRKDLRHAFSTKIADSLAGGVPLLLFAPETFAETAYLVGNKAAFVCTSEERLKPEIASLLNDAARRKKVVGNALDLANVNHDRAKNRRKMALLIEKTAGSEAG